MSTNLWDTKSRHNVQKLLDELLPMVNASGIRMNCLATYIALEELMATLPPSSANRGILIGAICRVKHSGQTTVEDLEGFYCEALGKHQQVSPPEVPWTFLVPVTVQVADEVTLPARFTMLGTDLEFVTRGMAAERIGDPKGLGDSMMLGRRKPVDEIPEVYLTFGHEGTRGQEAWAHVGPTVFDSFRGIVDLIHGYRGWRSGTEMPRTRMPLEGWMIAKTADSPFESVPFISDSGENFRLKPFPLDREAVQRITTYAELLTEEPGSPKSTARLITNCLRLYSEAMDATWNYRCLLALWQLAEALTLSDSFGGETKTVVYRLARFGEGKGLAGSGYRHALRRIASKGNDIVHRGIYTNIRDEDVNILKLACEEALVWAMYTQQDLPTISHIEMYYRFCDLNNADVEAAKNAIAYIEEHERLAS